MALLKKLPTPEQQIPALGEDPEYRPAAALLATLEAKHRALTDLIEMLELERHLRTRPLDSKSTTSLEQHARLRRLKAAVAATREPKAPASANELPEIAEALALIAGKPVRPPPDMAAQLAKLREDRDVIERAIRVQSEVVEDIRATKAYALAQRLADRNNALLIEHFRAAQELVRATAAVRALHADVTRAGYGLPRTDIMLSPLLRGALLLGNEVDWNSEIATLRRFLESKGLLP